MMDDAIHELDVVALILDLPQFRLRRGQVGTVVMEHSADAVEVEFVDEEGVTYALVPVEKSQLMRLYRHPVEAA